MIKYLINELKRCAFAIICLAVACTLFHTVAVLLNTQGIPDENYISEYDLNLLFTAVFGCIIAVVAPMFLLDYKHKKRSLDLLYSLPLSHTKILAVRYVIGLIALYSAYTLMYFSGMLVTIRFTCLNQAYYVYNYLANLIPLYIIYSVSAFLFTRSNTSLDGILGTAMWAFLPFVIIALAVTFLPNNIFYYDRPLQSDYYMPISPLYYVNELMGNLIVGRATGITQAEFINLLVGCGLWTALSIGATVALFVSERKARAENTGRISDGIFGLKYVTYAYAFFVVILSKSVLGGWHFLCLIAICIAAYLLTAYGARTVKIGIRRTVALSATILAAEIINVILFALNV